MGFKQEIRVSIYETDGDRVVHDKRVFSDADNGWTYFRNENPSIAYGGGSNGVWFVAWEHYKPKMLPPHNPSASTMDIKARTVKRNGNGLTLGTVIDVCDEDKCQADASRPVYTQSLGDEFNNIAQNERGGDGDYYNPE